MLTPAVVPESSGSYKDEKHRGSRSDLTPHCYRAVPAAGARPKLVEFDFELQGLPGDHLATESCPVDPAEKRKVAMEALVGQHCDAS